MYYSKKTQGPKPQATTPSYRPASVDYHEPSPFAEADASGAIPPDEHDPFRPAHWRWRRAAWLRRSLDASSAYASSVEDEEGDEKEEKVNSKKKQGNALFGLAVRKKSRKKSLTTGEDSFVKRAADFLRRFARLRGGYDHLRLAQSMPDIYYAYKLHRTQDQDDRWTVEARVLADEPAEDIARKQRTTPAVIACYEALFFDVRGCLSHRDYLVNRVLGPAAHRGVMERDYDLLLKIYALAGGPLAVDALVYMSGRIGSGRPHPRNHEEASAFWLEDGADTIRRKAAVSARCMPINPSTQHLILEAHHKLLELERDKEQALLSAGGAGGPQTVLGNIAACLAAVPFRPSHKEDGPSVFRAFDAMPVELRGDELLALGAGAVPTEAALEELSLFRFPSVPPSYADEGAAEKK